MTSILLLACLAASGQQPAARTPEREAQLDDAFVDVDHSSGEWTIGNSAVRYTLGITRQATLRSVALSIPGVAATITNPRAYDATLTIGGETFPLGAPGRGFVVEGASASTGTHFVALSVRFLAAGRGIRAIRNYLVYPGAAAIEMWTSIETLDGTPRVIEDLNAFEQTIVGTTVQYVTGLDTPASAGGAFSQRTRSLADGDGLVLGSATLSTEQTMPFFSVDGPDYRVFAGVAWSGAWSASLERDGDVIHLRAGLPGMSAVARPGEPVEGPHAFIGAASRWTGADAEALTRFVRATRGGRPFPALTTFNTWFVHGIRIDEDVLRRDIDYAASMGIELFQLDAGWYPRLRSTPSFDFTDGLGSWAADPERFPHGLAAMRSYAHGRGLLFGVWVEPERVALSTVGQPGAALETYLAQQHGAYRPGVSNDQATDAQICLAHPPARHWVEQKLLAFLDDVRPDNLKWDFNRWVHCTRSDHRHPANGGNYEHVRALYEMLALVRARYPAMTIENCAGGGHRLDFALARLTDTAWMDDRSAPSAHVRRNLNGLLALFPAPYLFSYVMADEDEPMHGAHDLPLLVRSRMPGVVGLAAALDQLSEGERNVLYQEFALAKRLRRVQQQAVTYALTAQRSGPGEWEVIQQLIPDSGTSYLFVFANGASGSTRVRPYGIKPETAYQFRSADRGVIGTLRGDDIIAAGLEIQEAPESSAQVLVLEPVHP